MMIDEKEPLTLFGYPVVEVETLGVDGLSGEIVVGRHLAGVTYREAPVTARLSRADFVRFHVAEIMKKGKTSASHRTKGKKLLERCEAIGDTGAGEEARAEFEMAEASDALIERHIAALITRTTREP